VAHGGWKMIFSRNKWKAFEKILELFKLDFKKIDILLQRFEFCVQKNHNNSFFEFIV
jgi:hypothetical protein